MVQARQNNTNYPFILSGRGLTREAETITSIAGRAVPLAPYTVMAQTAASRQWVPLQVVNPAVAPGRLVCGPVGSTQEQFAAVNNGAFRVTVDGVAFNVGPIDFTGMASMLDTAGFLTCGAVGATQEQFAAVNNAEFGISINGAAPVNIGPIDFTVIPSMLDTAGFLTCGAIGATQAQWAAVNNGEFGLALDGAAPVNVGPCDFTVIPSILDTRATLTCGVNGSLLAAWQAVTGVAVGDFQVTVDGIVYNMVGLDYALVADLNEVAIATTAAALGAFEVQYNAGTNTYVFLSNTAGIPSTITFLGPIAAPVNDISGTVGNTFFNGEAAPAVLVQGTGSDGYHQTVCDVLNDNLVAAFAPGAAPVATFVGGAIVFTSPNRGLNSAVDVLVAGGGGTDISGAGFLNGLVGVGVATPGAGHDGYYSSVADSINAAMAAVFPGAAPECMFNGAAFIFTSPDRGEDSAVAVLVAGGAGTDISGAGFLAGTAGAGAVATAGTGHDGFYADIAERINAAALGRLTCYFNGTSFVFLSPIHGNVSLLSAPTAGGTDISGVAGPGAFLAGTANAGAVVTAGTGGTGENIPTGIYMGAAITAAELVVGNVVNRPILIGAGVTVDENQVVLDAPGGLTLNSVVTPTGLTVRMQLAQAGIHCEMTEATTNFEN